MKKKEEIQKPVVKNISMKQQMMRSTGLFSMEDVMAHNTPQNAWTTVGGKVYDIASFLNKHPGGYHAIAAAIGKDGTQVFGKSKIILK